MIIGVTLVLQHMRLKPHSRSPQIFLNQPVNQTQGTAQHNCRIHHRFEPTLYGVFQFQEMLMLGSILDPILSAGIASEHYFRVDNTQLLALAGKLLQTIDHY